jgi:Cytochrome P460
MPNGPLRIPDNDDDDENNPHQKGGQTFARVFANDLALGEIYKDKPVFPAGSMIVREKLLKETDEVPALVTVMLKHEKGFSSKSNDWEYFVLDAALSKVTKNEKKGDCAKCHTRARETDMVFKTYLK